MTMTMTIEGKTISIHRERPSTARERAKDPDAKVMAECVKITFGSGPPSVSINRDLCGDV